MQNCCLRSWEFFTWHSHHLFSLCDIRQTTRVMSTYNPTPPPSHPFPTHPSHLAWLQHADPHPERGQEEEARVRFYPCQTICPREHNSHQKQLYPTMFSLCEHALSLSVVIWVSSPLCEMNKCSPMAVNNNNKKPDVQAKFCTNFTNIRHQFP